MQSGLEVGPEHGEMGDPYGGPAPAPGSVTTFGQFSMTFVLKWSPNRATMSTQQGRRVLYSGKNQVSQYPISFSTYSKSWCV